MVTLTRTLSYPNLLLLICISAVSLIAWACSSSPPPEPADPTATLVPIPTNTLVPAATSAPSDTPSTDPTPSALPTTREWNILGPLDAPVTIADFGDFQ